MTPRRHPLAMVLIAAALTSTAVAAEAQRPRELPAKVLVVLAKEEPGTIDPALRDEEALRKPPFNAFRAMEVLSKRQVRIQVGKPHEVNLPNGRTLRLTVERVMPDGRFRVRVSINRPNQKDYLPLLQVVASPGDPFFVAGQGHAGGTLVIGMRIGRTPSE